MKESKLWLIASIVAAVADFICSYGGSESYNDIFGIIGIVALATGTILSKLENIEGKND